MATRSWISDEQWVRVKGILSSHPRRGRPGNDDRRFFEAVVWWRRTGVPWRDLPDEFGPWKSVFNRFDRWSKNGRWNEVLSALQTALFELGLKPHQVAVVSGIGCSSNLPGFINTYGMHTLHGRSLAVGSGLKLANHELKVICTGGDGDV